MSEFSIVISSERETMENEDTCAVCMESLTTDHVHTMDGCGHRFHSGCIIRWMQHGHLTCPTCRGDLRHAEGALPAMAMHERAKHIRRTLGRRRNIPADLQRLFTRLRKAEAAEREHRRAFKDFQTAHRDIFKQYKRLRTKRWSHVRATGRCERLLGLYQGPGLTLPPLVVYEYPE